MSDIGREPGPYLDEKVKAGTISRQDADLLIRYIQAESARVGLKPHTAVSTIRYLSHTVERIPNPPAWTNADIEGYVSEVRRQYKQNTVRKHILVSRQFCAWMVKNKINKNLNAAALNEIKAPASDRMTKTAGMMLSNGEVEKIISAGRNVRDRCLLAVLAESGMRPFEVLDLRWGDLKFDEFGVIVNTAGKTERPRFIRLLHSVPYIVGWRNDSPAKEDAAFIFVGLRGTTGDHRISHAALKKIVRQAANDAGIKKRVSPYLFRHSSVTRMLAEGYSDSTIRMVHWGSQSTQMLATYGHVAPRQIDNEILERAGVKKATTQEKRKVYQCVHCQTILKPTDEFCSKCGKPQTPEAGAQVQSATAIAEAGFASHSADPKFIDAVARRMLELQSQNK